MIEVKATYGFPTDCCSVEVYRDGDCIGTPLGPWASWAQLGKELREEGTMDVLGSPDWPIVIVPLFQSRITISTLEMDTFCRHLLEALHAASVDRAGGARAYYERYSRRAALNGGGHWEPPEALGIGAWAEIGG